jgi:hypothetical protein
MINCLLTCFSEQNEFYHPPYHDVSTIELSADMWAERWRRRDGWVIHGLTRTRIKRDLSRCDSTEVVSFRQKSRHLYAKVLVATISYVRPWITTRPMTIRQPTIARRPRKDIHRWRDLRGKSVTMWYMTLNAQWQTFVAEWHPRRGIAEHIQVQPRLCVQPSNDPGPILLLQSNIRMYPYQTSSKANFDSYLGALQTK